MHNCLRNPDVIVETRTCESRQDLLKPHTKQVFNPKFIEFCVACNYEKAKKLTAEDLAMSLNKKEPKPKTNNLPYVWDLVLKDIEERDEIGAKKYGTRLQPHNGRDALKDAYQEALDLVVYLRQAIFEREEL